MSTVAYHVPLAVFFERLDQDPLIIESIFHTLAGFDINSAVAWIHNDLNGEPCADILRAVDSQPEWRFDLIDFWYGHSYDRIFSDYVEEANAKARGTAESEAPEAPQGPSKEDENSDDEEMDLTQDKEGSTADAPIVLD